MDTGLKFRMKSVNRNCSLVIIAVSLAFGAVAFAATENFDALRPGPVPSDWEGSDWEGYAIGTGIMEIVKVPDPGKRNALKLVGKEGRVRCIKPVKIRDGYVEVQGKTEHVPRHLQRQDRAPLNTHAYIGVIWRYQDENNYYLLQAKTDKMFWSKMVNGVERLVAKSPVMAATTGEWHTVRIEFTGQTIHVFWDGRELYTAADDTFLKAGAVGVWTGNGRTTYFDNFKYGAFASSVTEDFESLLPGSHTGGDRDTLEKFRTMKTLGPIPAPWKFGSTIDTYRKYPKGEPMWEIVERTYTRYCLKQSGYGSYLWCVKSDTNIRDGYVEVQGRVVSGHIDRVIALVWRFQDEKNYYVVRVNPLEQNICPFKVVNGTRSTALERSTGLINVPADVWHLLRVEFSGNTHKVLWNGRVLYTFTDDTFPGPGAVGMWTKTDAVTEYDNFSYGGD